MITLYFLARDHFIVEIPGDVYPAGRDVLGRPTPEGKCVVAYLHAVNENNNDPLRLPQPLATRVCIEACRSGKLWAANIETAKLCGVSMKE